LDRQIIWYDSAMAKRRTYGDACGVARALDRVGERWALMVVRELLLGPKRFTDLRTALPKVSPDVLAQRLRELTELELVTKRELPPPAASVVYELTPRGQELEPVIHALGAWGARIPITPDDTRMSLDAHILSFRTLYRQELATGFAAVIELRLDGRPFRAQVAPDGTFTIAPGAAPDADAAIAGVPGMILAIAHGRISLDEALRTGDVEVAGDRAAVERFVGLFPLPEPAGV
jgi:DNA-binding HxlR family transcriptional regulator